MVAEVRIPIFAPSQTLETICMADVRPRPIRWLWMDRIAIGKLTLIAGDPGLGKSLVTVALASAVSTGARWPVGDGYAPLGNVIMLSDEDALDDTIRPRLDAAGADCSRIHALKMVRDVDEQGKVIRRSFSLARDIERLAQSVEDLGDVALITIDPVSAYLDGADSHNNASVREVLSPISDMADRLGVAIVLVTHLNKGSGAAMYRASGSIAFPAVCRSSWIVAKDIEDSSRRLMLPSKNNLGPDKSGMAYRVETAENGSPLLMWEAEPVDKDIDGALMRDSDDAYAERHDAKTWLEAELYHGPVSTKDLQTRAREAGHSWSTVKRAKADLKVVAKKTSMRGGWEWYHPDDLPVRCEEDHEGAEGDHSKTVVPFRDRWSSSEEVPW